MLLPFSPKLTPYPKIFHPKSSSNPREPASRQARRNRVDIDRDLDFDYYLGNLFLETNMSIDPDTIYKALRPVPDFDGNPNVLPRFINICDEIVTRYVSTAPGNELSNLCLLNGILNKITGTAACTINSNGIPESWAGIRTALINNFSDQRDETALYNDLSLATQGNKTPQEFYDQCQTLFSTIMTYVTLHESVKTTVEAKRALYKKVTMQAFVRGLKEPLGSRIRCMRPCSIEKALEYVQEELNVMYLHQRHESPKVPPNFKLNIPTPPISYIPQPRPQAFQAPMPNWPMNAGPRVNQSQPQPFKFNPPQNQFRFNPPQNQSPFRMPTRTQQMLRALPPNYNPQSNVFRLPPRNNHPQNSGPKPMSGVQHFMPKTLPHTSMTGHDWFKSGNPPPTNYLKSRDMNVHECAPYEEYYPEYYHEPECYYPQYVDYNTVNDDYNPDEICYDVTYSNDLTDEMEPQPGSSHDNSDFRITKSSKKPK